MKKVIQIYSLDWELTKFSRNTLHDSENVNANVKWGLLKPRRAGRRHLLFERRRYPLFEGTRVVRSEVCLEAQAI